jgi:hypothetical protein
MIAALLAIESAIGIGIVRARKRASVIRTMSLETTDSAPLQWLSRSLATQTRVSTRFERVLATHLATTLRTFVRSNAFETLVLLAIGRVRSRILKGGIR